MIAEVAKVSSRGQVAIPAEIRKALNIKEGDQVLFVADGNQVLLRKAAWEEWFRKTESLRNSVKKVQESDVVDIVHAIRKRRARH